MHTEFLDPQEFLDDEILFKMEQSLKNNLPACPTHTPINNEAITMNRFSRLMLYELVPDSFTQS